MASIFGLEFQGRNLLSCMGTPLWKLALHVEPSKTRYFGWNWFRNYIVSPFFECFSFIYLGLIVFYLVDIWFEKVATCWCSYYYLHLSRYMRDFEVETIGLKETSRRCSDEKCGAKLKDTVLDWEVLYSLFSLLYFSWGSKLKIIIGI